MYLRPESLGIGAKRDPQAYEKIAKQLALAPEHLLFLSDIEEELDAALDAGMQTTWLVREDEPDATATHRQVSSFDQIEVGGP